VISFTETLFFLDVLLPAVLTTEVAIYFPLTADNSKLLVGKYTYAVTVENSKWPLFLKHYRRLFIEIIQEYRHNLLI
jgi:hypothetical protein